MMWWRIVIGMILLIVVVYLWGCTTKTDDTYLGVKEFYRQK